MIPGPHLAVADLEDFCLDHQVQGVPKRRHLWHSVVYRKVNWALIFAAYSEWTASKGWSDECYRLVRLRRKSGLWWTQDTFNLKPHHMPGMLPAVGRALGAAPGEPE